MLNRLKIKKSYVSETDEFLAEFDAKHPELSASQKAEIKKAQRISDARDNVKPDDETETAFENF